jgi:hypothetical protein
MPRKQNGWGNSKSLGFKGGGRVDKGKGKGAAGFYPSDRRYGTSVNRSVIEQYDLNSDWVKWRKGYEYFCQAAWYRLEDFNPITQEYTEATIDSQLYQGTSQQESVSFDGYKFATKNSDSNNHYVMKRVPTGDQILGYVTQVQNDRNKYPENYANQEIWLKGNPGKDSRGLLSMIGDRITDGETEATVDYVLNSNQHPAIYIGKTYDELTTVKVSIPKDGLAEYEPVSTYQEWVNKICYMPTFYIEKPLADIEDLELIDRDYYWGIQLRDDDGGDGDYLAKILDPSAESLPPSLYDINDLPTIAEGKSSFELKGTYIYQKDLYQRFWGRQYLTGDAALSEVDTVSYVIMPFKILGVEETPTHIILTSVPFTAEFKLYSPPDGDATIITNDYSYTKFDGTTLDTDVDPWMDEIWTDGNYLKPATIYTCSCPNHAHAMLRAPQSTTDNGTRKINRQQRYPMPTVLGKTDFDAIGTNKAAGLIESWADRKYSRSFKMCKHSVAAMFIDGIKVKEPNDYPSVRSRELFEEKLRVDISEVADEFNASYKRGGITTLEIIFALAQGLNLDDVELAYVILNSNF